ncbi:hypothetical protein ACO0LO_10365 [Undibacterium sp. TJN25]|uniref:hypothetical protein n=1 Tax=Undibacterium sp. TJN25 TaxID=3413056 RepID=UPI003BF428B5
MLAASAEKIVAPDFPLAYKDFKMNSITPLTRSYNSPAANALSAAQQKRAVSFGDTPIDTSGTTVAQAQAQSALQDQQDASIEAQNAASFQQLEAKGIKVFTISFDGIYKSKMLSSVDKDGDKSVSQSELYQQVQAGGGTLAQAEALYKAMDMDGDGTVSAKEFEDSIPNPFATPVFRDKLNGMFSDMLAGKADFTDLTRLTQPSVDPTAILSSLAKNLGA